MMQRMLKRIGKLALACCLIFAMAPAGARAQGGNPLTAAFTTSLNNVQRNLVESADLMPEEHYGFRPTPEVRPFGEWIEHTAIGNYNFCSAIKGVPNPHVDHPAKLSTKAEISQALKDSFAYCAAVVKELDDQKSLAEVTVGKNTYPRIRPMFAWIGSLNSHYGNIVVYLRLKNLVPPSTARAQKAPPAQKR